MKEHVFVIEKNIQADIYLLDTKLFIKKRLIGEDSCNLKLIKNFDKECVEPEKIELFGQKNYLKFDLQEGAKLNFLFFLIGEFCQEFIFDVVLSGQFSYANLEGRYIKDLSVPSIEIFTHQRHLAKNSKSKVVVNGVVSNFANQDCGHGQKVSCKNNSDFEIMANSESETTCQSSCIAVKQDFKAGFSGVKYRGKIFVDKDACAVKAIQKNKNIILGKNISIDATPELEILNNDVECRHGCAVGQFDKKGLFYLQSRGLEKKEAVKLLIESFFDNISFTDKDNDFESSFFASFISIEKEFAKEHKIFIEKLRKKIESICAEESL